MTHYASHSPLETLCGHAYGLGHSEVEYGDEPECGNCGYLMLEDAQEEARKMEAYVHPDHEDWELYHQLCGLEAPKKWPFRHTP